MSYRVLVPSRDPQNLVACLGALFSSHPQLPPEHVTVIDDGARPGAAPHLPAAVNWLPGAQPFVYARNVNLGIRATAPHDVVLLGDDVEIATPGGLDRLAAVGRRGDLGAVSPGIRGAVGNAGQRWEAGGGTRREADMLVFVCVWLARRAVERVGLLDERFSGYGFEDVDYGWRLRRAGLGLATCHDCVVDHARLPSSFRSRPDQHELSEHNRRLLWQKWQLSQATAPASARRGQSPPPRSPRTADGARRAST